MQGKWALAAIPVALVVSCGGSGGESKQDREMRAVEVVQAQLPDCGPDQNAARLAKCSTAAHKLSQILIDTCDDGPDQLALFIAMQHDQNGALEGAKLEAQVAVICPDVYAKIKR